MGTSSWSSTDWVGPFYPPGTKPPEFISEYARHFDTVEVDSSFYRIPTRGMVEAWRRRTPPGFLFALKVPRVITHDKLLTDCTEELHQFLSVVDLLGEKRGPILFQFPYFNKKRFNQVDPFLNLLGPFLGSLPKDFEYAVEIRNKHWVTEKLLGILREYGVAFTLIDHPWMHRIDRLMEGRNLLTAPFTYVRWLGDRHGIEKKTKSWDRVILDRTRELSLWVPHLQKILDRGTRIYGFFNNHYAGHAPASIELFRRIWDSTGHE